MLLNKQVPLSLGARRVKAVVFDWAGTTVDFGSLAPVRTLQRVFAEAQMAISEPEARRDMGIAKRDHIAAILRSLRGAPAPESEIDDLYARFIPLQFESLGKYAKLIPGVLETVKALKERSIAIASTTGYTRDMLAVLLAEAARQGYKPYVSFSPEDVGAGRPYPFMIYSAAVALQVYPLSSVVKVGDTPADIHEGLNAGAWSVGVSSTGNGIGLSEAEFSALDAPSRAARIGRATEELTRAGAHYVIETLCGLNAVIDDIEARLAGDRLDQ